MNNLDNNYTINSENLFIIKPDFEKQNAIITLWCDAMVASHEETERIQEGVDRLEKTLIKHPNVVPFVASLPHKLQTIVAHTFALKGAAGTAKAEFVATLPFYLQTYFIPLFKNEALYNWAFNLYKQDPALLMRCIEAESLTLERGAVPYWMGSRETILFFDKHPQLLKMCLQYKPPHSLGDPFAALVKQGKESWIEKLCLLYTDDPKSLIASCGSLSEKNLNPALIQLLNLDIKLFEQYSEQFIKLMRLTFSEGVEKLLAYVNQKTFFKALVEKFSEKPEQVAAFLALFEQAEAHKQEWLKGLVEMGCIDLAHLALLLHMEIAPSAIALAESLVATMPAEVKKQLEAILDSWSVRERKTINRLISEELLFLSKLLLLAFQHPDVFHSVAPLCTLFPLPAAGQLLEMNLMQLRHFKQFIQKHPQFAAVTLKYVTKNPAAADRLFDSAKTEPREIVRCLKAQNPFEALDLWLASQTATSSAAIRQPDERDAMVKKIEALVKTASEKEAAYLNKMALLDYELGGNSDFVIVLFSLYPTKYETLLTLALEGYLKEAQQLLQRVMREKPRSHFTTTILNAIKPKLGSWLTAALQLGDPDQALMDHLSDAEELTPLDIQLTHLAAAGERELVKKLLSAHKGPHDTASEALLDWTEAGKLSLVCWVFKQDQSHQDLLYKQLRNLSNSALQESLLILYRNLSAFPEDQENALSLLLKHRTSPKTVFKLLYLLTHEPEQFFKIINQGNYSAIEEAIVESQPIKKLNEAMEKIKKIPEIDLKRQLTFSLLVADLLLSPDGSLNSWMLSFIRESKFYSDNRDSQSSLYHYLHWLLDSFEQGEFSERLAQGTPSPISDSPAHKLIQLTLNKKEITRRDAQVAILSALLQRPWQTFDVGSCFATSVTIQSHSTERKLLQTLDDYFSLIKDNHLKRSVEYPIYFTDSFQAYEHPLAKGREYCIASMAVQSQKLKENGTLTLFDQNGAISLLLAPIARKDPPSYMAIQALLERLKQEFLNQSMELYDPTLTEKGKEGMGGWILGDRSTYTKVDTRKQYEQFLLKIVNQLEKEFPAIPEAFTLLKQKISAQEFAELTKKVRPLWAVGGGAAKDCENRTPETYFEQPNYNPLKGRTKSHKGDLKALHCYAHHLSKSSKQPYDSLSVTDPSHSYTLLTQQLQQLQKFANYEELKAHLSQQTDFLTEQPIDSALAKKWMQKLCSELPPQAQQKLRHSLKRHPIPLIPLSEFGWRLLDRYLRATNGGEKEYPAAKTSVEKVLLDLGKHPSHIIVGDYNWPNQNHDASYAAYGLGPLTQKIEPYCVGEQGRNLSTMTKRLPGIKFHSKIPDKPWVPLSSDAQIAFSHFY